MKPVDWSAVRRILVVKLRSIGDTVLSTPSLIALQRHAPQAEIDVLLEDWVAPVLEAFEGVNVISIGSDLASRSAVVRKQLRPRKYDVAFNPHGGTTSTFLTWASGAKHRFGDASYQYSFLHNHVLSSAVDFWGRDKIHSAEQQLALIGYAGVPVYDLPRTKLDATDAGLTGRIQKWMELGNYALLHPGTLFETKRWPAENFAKLAEYIEDKGLSVIALTSPAESLTLRQLTAAARSSIVTFDDLTLPEITALASKARIFVGNDSGIAHIAAAVQTPTVVIFGSSNRVHWRPWTDAPNEIVFNPFECQPCPGYRCEAFGDSRCIHSVTVEQVSAAVDRVLAAPASLTQNP